MDRKKMGEPLGDPDNRGTGRARPDMAGEEGGMGSYGDQRRHDDDPREDRRREPPLDGTMTHEDVEGDTDDEKPGANAAALLWDGPRLNMDERKRQPLIIW